MCLGIPMRVVEIISTDKARVETGKVTIDVSTQLVEEIKIGDYVIIHAGFALQVMDMKAAEETLDLLDQMAQCGD